MCEHEAKGCFECTWRSVALRTICPLSDGHSGEEDLRHGDGPEEDQEWADHQVHYSQSAPQNSHPFSAYAVTLLTVIGSLCFVNSPIGRIDLSMTEHRLDKLYLKHCFKFALIHVWTGSLKTLRKC